MSIDLTMYNSTRYSIGVRRRRRRRKGALAWDRPDTEGALRTGMRKAWPLRLSAGSHFVRVHSVTDAGGHAGASVEGTGGHETPPIRVSRLLTIKDLAEQLQIKSATLYSWTAQGKIPSRKIHGLIRFVPLEIDRWLASFSPPQSVPLQIETRRADHADLNRLIARAKEQAYNPAPRRNQTEIKSHRKGGA
jgi:excisionase family DNA binding protein